MLALAGGTTLALTLTDRPLGLRLGAWCTDTTMLRVTAAPDIAPIVEDAAKALQPEDSTCERIQLTVEEPGVTANKVRTSHPDVWIPSSSAWLGIANIERPTFVAEDWPLAHSPIVLATPQAYAASVWNGRQVGWADIVAKVTSRQMPRASMPNPLHTTVGLLSVYGVQSAMARTTTDSGIAQLRALTLRSRLADATVDVDELLNRYAQQTDWRVAANDIGAFPVTEQQLWTYQRAAPKVPLAGQYPADGMVEADYPVAIAKDISNDPDHRQLSERFVRQLRSTTTAQALLAAGFRLPEEARSEAVPSGLPASYPTPLPSPPKADKLLGSAVQWSQYRKLSFQVLLLVDTSGSMNDPVVTRSGRRTTKANLLRESGASAAQLFSEQTSLALWYFGSPSAASPAYTEVVPYGPMTGSVNGTPRQKLLASRIAGYRAVAGAGTPLYKTILDGATVMRERVKPETLTLVVVLTDGHDEGSRFAMSREAFLTRLTSEQRAERPMPIFGIGLGANADMESLEATSRATGGQAVAVADPQDLASAMAEVFLAAHAPS